MANAANFLSFDDIDTLDDKAYAARLRSVEPEPASTTIARLSVEITGFERKYGISSEAMQQSLASGTREESLDFCDWLQAVALRNRLASSSTR